jgi:methylmalonyl-CoA mutase cobalamin-binding subunit
MLIATINGQAAGQHFLASFLQDAGFHVNPSGLNFRRALLAVAAPNA